MHPALTPLSPLPFSSTPLLTPHPPPSFLSSLACSYWLLLPATRPEGPSPRGEVTRNYKYSAIDPSLSRSHPSSPPIP
ncbi:hypothetical protein IE53DRAFT_390789 [Violaceomyces palustris]|uniref:Uncharacterized protein n=1 Tax=Violaceomyces palustris TaxID=1673888 RepID=A0ACD0NMQ4_9BASI|nr:hypothetical protein IE53DRAFT_390789 [Violaceomyces palustris]